MYQVKYYFCTYMQTWNLLQLTVKGFSGLCQDFLAKYPGYIVLVRINGSVVESLFGRFKFNAEGHLSAIKGCSHEINSHEINFHEISSRKINSHEINFS